MKPSWTTLLFVIILSGCFPYERTPPALSSTPISAGKDQLFDSDDPSVQRPVLSLANYPTGGRPYHIEIGNFWLVHTLEGQLFSFVAVSPEYAEHISVDECHFAWSEAVKRFVDPCSGDEWELNGHLNLDHSTELWSSRDLDQFVTTIEDGMIYIHLDQKIPGTTRP